MTDFLKTLKQVDDAFQDMDNIEQIWFPDPATKAEFKTILGHVVSELDRVIAATEREMDRPHRG